MIRITNSKIEKFKLNFSNPFNPDIAPLKRSSQSVGMRLQSLKLELKKRRMASSKIHQQEAASLELKNNRPLALSGHIVRNKLY